MNMSFLLLIPFLMPRIHDVYITFLFQYSKQRKLQNESFPHSPKKIQKEELAWFKDVVEYLTLLAYFKF